jgi:hypothetical protein
MMVKLQHALLIHCGWFHDSIIIGNDSQYRNSDSDEFDMVWQFGRDSNTYELDAEQVMSTVFFAHKSPFSFWVSSSVHQNKERMEELGLSIPKACHCEASRIMELVVALPCLTSGVWHRVVHVRLTCPTQVSVHRVDHKPSRLATILAWEERS